MKVTLSQTTLAILKNFAGVNTSIWFKEGNTIKTRSNTREVIAIAQLEETLPQSFAVYDLPRFMNVCKLFGETPELDFGSMQNGVSVGQGNQSVQYVFSDPIIIPDHCIGLDEYDKNPKMPNSVATFTLKHEQLQKLIQAAGVLGSPNITIKSDGENVDLVTHDKKNSLCDQYKLRIDSQSVTGIKSPFTVELKLETLRILPGEYKVVVGEKIAVRFTNTALPVEYFICGQISVS